MIDTPVSILELTVELLGTTGPVTLDTGIKAHSLCDDPSEFNDEITIGQPKQKIGREDLAKLVKHIQKQMTWLSHTSSKYRCYAYSGYQKTDDRHFMINWSS